jgi:hypothetical protein
MISACRTAQRHNSDTLSGQTAAMPMLRFISAITDAGDPDRLNEDAVGSNAHVGFVIDGATGLGEGVLGEPSDAAWLARLAAEVFERELDGEIPVGEVVRSLNSGVAKIVEERRGSREVEGWQLPVAGFELVRIEGDAVVAHGLGDCRLFLVGADGEAFDTSPIAGNARRESEGARRAIAHAGGLTAWRSLSEQPEVREELRRHRARYNRAGGGVWTLGTAPDAADHIAVRRFTPALPATGLLCTDGFAALADSYGRYDVRTFVEAAKERGLAALLAELRRIEREEDPDGRRFPRFKVSDDASALLFEVQP